MIRSTLVLALTSAMSLPAAAQAVPQDTARRDTMPLAPIVVTATRTPEPVGILGNSVSVLAGDELIKAGITNVSDALRVMAGASVVQQGGPGSVTSLFLRGGQSTYVRVLVDGVPVNEAGGSIDLAHLTTANVERIELVRGPGSVTHGSDAMTGVLQIITRQTPRAVAATRRPPGPVRFNASARGGTFESRDAVGELTAGSARAGVSIGGGHNSSDGFYEFNNYYRNSTETGSAWWRPDNRTDLRLSARYNDVEYHFPTEGSGVPTDSNQNSTTRGTTLSFDAGRKLTTAIEVRTLFGFHESKDIYDDRPDHPGDTIFGTYHSEVVTDRRNADLRFNVRAGGAVYTVGAVLDAERGRGWDSFGGSPAVERTNRAVYGQLLRAWPGGASLQAGVRLEDNEAFGTHVTWRAGGALRVAPETRLRLNAGTAFKEPTFLQNFNSSFSTGNPDLDPERSTSVEAGIEHRFAAARATVSATVFMQWFRDMIQYSPLSAPPAPSYYNIAGANASGLETDLSWRPGGGLHVRAEYTMASSSLPASGSSGGRPTAARSAWISRRPAASRWAAAGCWWARATTWISARSRPAGSPCPAMGVSTCGAMSC